MAAPWLRSGIVAIALQAAACGSGGPTDRPRTDAGTSEEETDAGTSEAETDADASALSAAIDGASYADANPEAEADASGSACDDFANAYCQRYQSCDSLAFALAFGDASLCVARESPWCQNQFGSAGGTLSVPSLEACTRATAAQSCATFFSENPPECSWAGTEEAGAPCAHDLQCAGGFCFVPANAFCGTCRAPLHAADPCDPEARRQCANGLVCGKVACPANGGPCTGTEQWQCVAADGGAGDPCTNWAACTWPLVCDGIHCVQPPGPGESCPMGQCDDTQDLYCAASPDGGARTCDRATYVPAGMPCDLSASHPLLCSASATCRSVTGTPTLVGTCMAAAADGQSCLDALCVPPSICANGVCQAPALAASCQ